MGTHKGAKPNTIEIYTDGACSPNPGEMGIGIVLRFKHHQKEISKTIGEGTNQIAEVTAIYEALKQVKDPLMPVIVYSDSMYALKTLSGEWKPKKNIPLINKAKKLLSMFANCNLVWVKGHNGNKFNERADYLAGKDLPEWRYK